MRIRKRTEQQAIGKNQQRTATKSRVHEFARVPIAKINPAARNPRIHSDRQIEQIAASMEAFGVTNPVLIDERNQLIAGHGRVAAAKRLGLEFIPAITISDLTSAQKRALLIADNKIAENASWDRELLALELQELSIEADFELEITGLSSAEIDLLIDPTMPGDDEADEAPDPERVAVSIVGDVWTLGKHRMVVGDIRNPLVLRKLLLRQKADAVFTDPPFNVPVQNHVRGHGRKKHREFLMASGEMSDEEFDEFLVTTLGNLAAYSKDGAIHFVCMDWRHIEQLLRAGRQVYSELKNLAVWVKTNGGMGSFYRSQHEMVAVFKVGSEAHQNNIALGRDGRYRTNVWEYAGSNAFQARRNEELDLHPTVKPVTLVADAIKDVTRRGEIVLDGFAGSGTTLIAAEKTGRVARVAEIDPLYADVIIRRWEKLTGEKARNNTVGASFAKTARQRNACKEVA